MDTHDAHDAQRDYLDGFRDGRASAPYSPGRSVDYAKGFQAGEATCPPQRKNQCKNT